MSQFSRCFLVVVTFSAYLVGTCIGRRTAIAGPEFTAIVSGSLIASNPVVAQQFATYIDAETGLVLKPEGWDDRFGDCVWRSSWTYASLLTIYAKDRVLYDALKGSHGVDVMSVQRFLDTCLSRVCKSDGEWQVPGSDQQFSRDQLAAMLYLLATVHKYGDDPMKERGRNILLRLNDREQRGVPLSNSGAGAIGDNLRYTIAVLADDDRYGFNYKTSDQEVWLAQSLGNLKAAKANRRSYYKLAFAAALKIQQQGSLNHPGQPGGVFDETAFFNAVAIVTAQALAWGPGDSDVKVWRSTFDHAAKSQWGPAFRIAAGAPIDDGVIASYSNATTCRDIDNDIVMAQRPEKFINGVLPTCISCDGTSDAKKRVLVLDFLILRGLHLNWN